MDPQTQARYSARARVVKAMAHPTRLFILDRLAKDTACVCELTELVGADISTVSKHLAVLKSAGILEDEKRGVQVFYRLKIPCVMGMFSCIESVLQDAEEKQLELV